MNEKQSRTLLLISFSAFFLFSSCAGPSAKKKELIKNTPTDRTSPISVTSEGLERYHQLLKDPHMEIRLAAAKVLMDQGDTSGQPVLLEALKGEDKHFRIDSFLELAERPTKEILPSLENALRAEQDAMTRFIMKRSLKDARNKLK